MNKSTQKQVDQAVTCIELDVMYAVRLLCALHRSASTAKTAQEIVAVMQTNNLLQYTETINNCLVSI